mmetsp:Transcript_9729/g.16133  ORF Transcript_9729/g.16133 Transcript_9729/m.16133 type:complete len:217 (-) Transcript_9729:280-930(-)
MTRELPMHGARLNKLAQVMLGLLVNDVDSKCFIKRFRCPNAAKAVGVLLGVAPIRLRNFRIHVNNAKEAFHRLLARPGVFVCVLPESFDLASLLFVLAIGIVMETNAAFCRIKIVSNRKTPDTDGHFLSLENHGLIEIVGNVDHEMASREAKPGRPVRLQLRSALHRGDTLRLAHVAQMLALRTSFVVSVTHNGPGMAQRSARLFIDGSYNISQIG